MSNIYYIRSKIRVSYWTRGEKKRRFLIRKDFFFVCGFIGSVSLREKYFLNEVSRGVLLIANPYFLSCLEHRQRRNCSAVFRIQSPATFLQPPQQAKRPRHRITPTSARRPRVWEREGGRQETNRPKYENFSFFPSHCYVPLTTFFTAINNLNGKRGFLNNFVFRDSLKFHFFFFFLSNREIILLTLL